MPLTLERFGDGFAFRAGLRAGFGGQDEARIPIAHRVNPSPHPILKEIYSCEVAGQSLEAANVQALRSRVAVQLDSIAPARTLPLCWFVAPGYELAVYERGDEIVCPLARLKARDLAGIRRAVCHHLVSAGYAADEEQVAVGVLQPRDLRMVPPAAVMCSDVEPDVWLPAVEGVSAEGPVLGVLDHAIALGRERRGRRAGPARREEMPVAPDVIGLLRAVRAEWAPRRRLREPEALHAAYVQPGVWEAAEARTRDTGRRLAVYLDDLAPLELVVRYTGAGDLATALEDRGITVMLGADEAELAAAVGRHLLAAGFLRQPYDVEVRDAAPARPERLDPDAISTEEAHA